MTYSLSSFTGAPLHAGRLRVLRAGTQGLLLRFVDGRPVSAVTTQFLGGLTERLAAEGKTALLLVGENASWHVNQAVRTRRTYCTISLVVLPWCNVNMNLSVSCANGFCPLSRRERAGVRVL